MLHDRSLVRDLADLITAKDHFARLHSGALYVYEGGVFRPGADLFVSQRVKHILLERDCPDRWSRALAREVIEFILLDVPDLPETPSLRWVNVENGMLDVATRTLRPHAPEFLSTVRIPIHYSDDATCLRIDRFLAQVFPADSIDLAWEILADLITPERSIQKAVCLVGEGGTGKSTFLELATRFVGAENVCHLSLQKLENDRFAAARLFGKLANICSDLPAESLDDAAVFKAITGGDRLTAELKYQNAFEFRPLVRLLFSANRLPNLREGCEAYLDR